MFGVTDMIPMASPLLILIGVVFLAAVALGLFAIFIGKKGVVEGSEREKTIYQYTAKKFFLTRAEHEFYDVLNQAIGNDYRIFAQVHLSSILDEKIIGQSWKAARAHINRTSVDFLLCDKQYLSPKLLIELDDKTHERPDRIERDSKVERILKQAGLPLLRVKNNGSFDSAALSSEIRAALGAVNEAVA